MQMHIFTFGKRRPKKSMRDSLGQKLLVRVRQTKLANGYWWVDSWNSNFHRKPIVCKWTGTMGQRV